LEIRRIRIKYFIPLIILIIGIILLTPTEKHWTNYSENPFDHPTAQTCGDLVKIDGFCANETYTIDTLNSTKSGCSTDQTYGSAVANNCYYRHIETYYTAFYPVPSADSCLWWNQNACYISIEENCQWQSDRYCHWDHSPSCAIPFWKIVEGDHYVWCV